MPKLEYFLVSESISVDLITNRISFFHVIEELRSPHVPFHIAKLVATATWILSEEDIGHEIETSVRITVPGVAEPINFPQRFVAERRRHRINWGIVGLAVQGFGELVFDVLLNDQHQASHSVTITQMDPIVGLAGPRPPAPVVESQDRA